MCEFVDVLCHAVHDLVDHPVNEAVLDLVKQRDGQRLIIDVVSSSVAMRGGLGGARVVHADSPFAGQNVS